MKVKLKEAQEPKKVTNYPYLGKHESSPLLVLFSELDTGISIIGNSNTMTGKYATNWSEGHDFTPYRGKVILSND